MGINPKGSPICYRLYPKTTDSNKQLLPKDEHRLRIEVTLNHEALKDTESHFYNLTQIIKSGFKYLTFTVLSNHTSLENRAKYREQIHPFGLELENTRKFGKVKTSLITIKPHAKLNKIAAKAIYNLYRKF
jgi:hypothetical protein